MFLAVGAAASAENLSDLQTGAMREGALTLIGLPHDQCSFGTIIERFREKYPQIRVEELDPQATSDQQLERLRSNDAASGAVADVVHLDYVDGPVAKAEDLLLPFIANNLNELPLPAFDVEYGDRYWSGAYFYVSAMLINTDLVPNPPKDWADLLKPEYAGQVAFPPDASSSPMTAIAVLTAGRALANEGESMPVAGLEHFANVAKAGNFAPVAGTPETVADGTTPILVLSDADALRARDLMTDAPLAVVIPLRGVTADIHSMAITAAGAHPNAAKLWFEHLYTGTMQVEMLRGYCHPILWSDYADWDTIPPELLAGKPSSFVYTLALFPTLQDRLESEALVASRWDVEVANR